MTSSQEFRRIDRRSASGVFLDGRLELTEGAPRSSEWFPCGVYTIDGGGVVVVDEPMDLLQQQALARGSVPGWATAVTGSALLSAETEVPPRIEVEVLLPGNLDEAQAAFASVCASYDDGFHDANPVDGLVRVGERVLRVRAQRDARSATWSGNVDEADGPGRREMARWRLYRSVDTRWGWGGWNQDGFRISTASPYDVADMVHFDILPLDGLEVAVFQEPLTPEQRGLLADAPRPPWIDVVAIAHLRTPGDALTARIEVDLVTPGDVDPTTVAVAVAASFQLHGRFDVEVEDCIVQVVDEQISVRLTLDEDLDGHTWSVRTRPARQPAG
jgi:hypothetical protein